jgi:uncharacterized OsmC-like protein
MKKKDSPRVNNVDLEVVRETTKAFKSEGGHHHVEKSIEGSYSLDGGPSFAAELHSDSSSFVVTSDEPKILGGFGVHPSPLSYLLYGVLACYANALAIQCSLEGVSLRRLRVNGRLSYDVGPMLTDTVSPLVKALRIEVEADRDIGAIIELANERCPGLYAIDHAIETEVVQRTTKKR